MTSFQNPPPLRKRPALQIFIASAALFFLAGISGFGQQFVQNGGFETGDFTGWTQSGNTAATFVSTTGLYARAGAHGAQLGPSTTLGYLTQTLATTAGQTYLLSLWLDSPSGLTPTEFQVSWGGNVLYDQSNLGKFGWVNLQFTVTATNAATVLQFGFYDNPDYLGLDDVSVIPTNETVAVYGAPSDPSWNDDVVNKLRGAGLPLVDGYFVSTSSGNPVPTLAQLQHYGAVLVYSDNFFNDPLALERAGGLYRLGRRRGAGHV